AALGLYAFRYYLLQDMTSNQDLTRHVDGMLAGLFIILPVALLASAVLVGRMLSISLAGIIAKTRELAAKGELYSFDDPFSDFHIAEPGELSELEMDLNFIRKNLIESHEKSAKDLTELETLMSKVTDAIIAIDT